jgi:hypothetical protein
MKIVCLVEHLDGQERPVAREVLGAARRVKEQAGLGEVLALVTGRLADAARLGHWGADRGGGAARIGGPAVQ